MLKIEQRFLTKLQNGEKTCEVRENDKDYQRGDLIHFWENFHTSVIKDADEDLYEITHVLGGGKYGIDPNYCVLSIVKTTKWKKE